MSGFLEQFSLLRAFLKGGFHRTLLWCALGLLIAAAVGYWAAAASPEATETILQQFTEMIQESGVIDETGSVSAFGLLTHNWTAMLVMMLYGFVPFLFLSALALFSNGALLGVLAGWYQSQGLSMGLYLAGILPHGVFELSALVLAAACGVKLCRNMCLLVTSNADRVPMTELLSDLLRVLLLLIAPLVVAAAFIEAYVTPVIMGLFMS